MDDLTREMDFSGGLSGEKGETSEFMYGIFKRQYVDIDVYIKRVFFTQFVTHKNTYTYGLLNTFEHLSISSFLRQNDRLALHSFMSKDPLIKC